MIRRKATVIAGRLGVGAFRSIRNANNAVAGLALPGRVSDHTKAR
jgi:hypothetical protein